MRSIKFILFTVAALSSVAADTTCGPCTCFVGDDVRIRFLDLKVAQCWNKPGLTTMPDLPADIQVLSILEGSISKLNDSQFTSYRRLQQIEINNNNIGQIEQGAFRYMANVMYIILENNKITELPSDFFTFSPNLTAVALEKNKIKRLQTNLFNNLKYLTKVYLNNNDMTTIEEYCFMNVPQLEEIHLDSNKLIYLDIKFIDTPSSLKFLYLQDNPWHCDTSLCGVLDTVVSGELSGWYGPPTCTTPQNLTKREWSEPLLTELCLRLPNIPAAALSNEPRLPQPQNSTPTLNNKN